MQNIFVFGHRNPDTDSVCAAISFSYLKNRMGFKTVPKVLGHINRESKFALDYFRVPEPGYLNDVKIQIKNMTYQKKAMVYDHFSIFAAYEFMRDHGFSGVPVVDENKYLKGIITLKEISTALIDGDIRTLHTSYDNIVSALHAKPILKFDEEIQGKVIAASYNIESFVNDLGIEREDILIIGNRFKLAEYAIKQKIKMLILVGNHQMPEDLIALAKQYRVNVIETTSDTYETANKMKLCNYVDDLLSNDHPVTFDLYDYRNEFVETVEKVGHTNYPIVNKKNECVGMIKATNVNSFERPKVILVDHNQASQSVEGIEEAEIVEVIDHHNLGTIGTNVPINFRSMPVGCTCTVIYKLYQEYKIEIPRDIAGLMLSAILSDTLLLKSPTTTDIDKDAVAHLAKLAGVDWEEYGFAMLRAGSSVKGMSFEEVFYQDFKTYKVDNDTIGISQIMTMDFDDIKQNIQKYVELLNTISYRTYKVAVMFVTDIIKNGSYIIFNEDAKEIVEEAYNIKDIQEGTYIPGLVSRKKQMLPDLMEIIEKRG